MDVEQTAKDAAEVGAGYVILALGQHSQYSCAPNPVVDKYWKLEPGQFNSRRDLPMDLYEALEKRGIALMLYSVVQGFLPIPERPAGMTKKNNLDYWLEASQWYSDHYGKKVKGWWIDGGYEWIDDISPGHLMNIHKALRHGNISGVYMWYNQDDSGSGSWTYITAITSGSGRYYEYYCTSSIDDDKVWIKAEAKDTGGCESKTKKRWVKIDSTRPTVTNTQK